MLISKKISQMSLCPFWQRPMGATWERKQVNLGTQKVEDKAQDTSHPSPPTRTEQGGEGQALGKWREIVNHVL